MKVSRPLGVLMALAMVATISPASSQTPEPDWKSLPYFRHDYGGWMRVWTNENTFANGVRLLDATSSFSPYPGPTSEESANPFQAMWASRCKALDAQNFKTTRQVYVMGTPDVLKVSLGAWAYSSKGKPSPIDRVKLLINGTKVHEVTGTAAQPIPFDAGQRIVATISGAPLRYGLNEITVAGHKRKTRKAAGWCRDSNRFGILGEVYGEFLADLAVSDAAFEIRRADLMTFDVTITNGGPSDLIPFSNHVIPGSAFGVTVLSGTEKVSALAVFDLPGCPEASPYSSGGKSGFTINCPLPRMQPGTALTANVMVRWDEPYNPQGSTDITYTAFGYAESTPAEQANNSKTFTVVPTN